MVSEQLVLQSVPTRGAGSTLIKARNKQSPPRLFAYSHVTHQLAARSKYSNSNLDIVIEHVRLDADEQH
jgi:hypothetical protein